MADILLKGDKMRFKTITVGIICLFLIFSGLYSQELSEDYRIGPKDLLEIRVIGHEDASTTTRVSEGGKISMPYLKEVEVEGLTKIELEKKLEELLSERYFENPQVIVFIQEHRSKIVAVIGAVRNPGEYELIGRQTLMDIISKAGGYTGEEGKVISVFRKLSDDTTTSLQISRESLFYRGDSELNILLQPGDVINVPIDRIIHIFVMGEVRNPGMLDVKKSELPNFTLLKALAQAGGFSDDASKGSVKVIRTDEQGKKHTYKFDAKDIQKGKKPDFILLEGDIVVVPKSIF